MSLFIDELFYLLCYKKYTAVLAFVNSGSKQINKIPYHWLHIIKYVNTLNNILIIKNYNGTFSSRHTHFT